MSSALHGTSRLSPVSVACAPISASCRTLLEPCPGGYYSDSME
jgi:hypothetical protein